MFLLLLLFVGSVVSVQHVILKDKNNHIKKESTYERERKKKRKTIYMQINSLQLTLLTFCAKKIQNKIYQRVCALKSLEKGLCE